MKDKKTQSTCPDNPDGIDNCNGQGLAVTISEGYQEEWIICPCKATDERITLTWPDGHKVKVWPDRRP